MGAIISYPKFMALDANGDPLSGGKLYTYEQNSQTAKATYSDEDLATPNANPVVLDSRGEAVVFGAGYYKFVLKDSDDVTIWTFDDILAGSEISWVSISDYGLSLATAVTTIGATKATLLIDQAITVSDNVTVPANINLWVLSVNNGAIQVDSGKTVTYNCTITAGAYQIFGGSGTHTTSGLVGEYNEKWELSGNHHVRLGGIVLPEQTTVPTTVANQGAIYTKVLSGQSELYFKEESDGDQVPMTDQGSIVVPRGYIAGLKLSNDTDTAHDIAISAGICRDSTNTVNLALASTLTKQIDVGWVVGDDQGGMFTGAVGNNTWYHLFLIRKDTDGTIDAGFDTSPTAANIPAGYTKYRRIGSVFSNGTADIHQFIQNGDEFKWKDPSGIGLSYDGTISIAGRSIIGLYVPPDISVVSMLNVVFGNSVGATELYISDLAVDDENASSTASPLASLAHGAGDSSVAGYMEVRTNTSKQIGADTDRDTTTLRIQVLGWKDRRGQDD